MTFAAYRKALIGLQGFAFALPAAANLFDRKSIFFPPMGDDIVPWKLFAMFIVGSSCLIPYHLLSDAKRKIAIGAGFLLFILSASCYMWVHTKYVVAVPRPNGSHIFVIRGTERNPDLKEPYRSMSDEDLTQHSGQSDDALELAYKRESLIANRGKVFGSYVASLVLLEFFLGSCAVTKRTH